MSEIILQQYLTKFAERLGLSQYDAMMRLRGEHTPSLKEPFADYLRSLDERGAREALAVLVKMP